MRLLTWNLFHGRAEPPAGRELLAEFAAAIASWSWDVALLQEVPPWWPPTLAGQAGAQQRTALTSRNGALALRRAIAERRPDLIRSNGGGSNAVLSRGAIHSHQTARLRLWPERRVAQLVSLASGVCVVNLHASRQQGRAERELAQAFLLAGGSGPAVVGGDFNLRDPAPPAGFVHLGGHGVDHLCGRGVGSIAQVQVFDVPLSDHAPVLCELARA